MAGAELATSPVHDILREANGVLWIGTDKGLFRSDARGTNFAAFPLPLWNGLPPSVTSLCRDDEGRLWIGTKHGAFVMDAAAQTVRAVEETRPEMVSGEQTLLRDEQVVKITKATPGVMWLGTFAHGIVAVDTKTLQTHRIVHDVALASSLVDDGIEALYRDREGTLWVGTRRGVSRTDPQQSGVLTFYGGSSRKDRIADSDVFSVLAEPKGTIWLGLGKHGVDLFDWTGRRVGALRPDPVASADGASQGHGAGAGEWGSGNGLYRQPAWRLSGGYGWAASGAASLRWEAAARCDDDGLRPRCAVGRRTRRSVAVGRAGDEGAIAGAGRVARRVDGWPSPGDRRWGRAGGICGSAPSTD